MDHDIRRGPIEAARRTFCFASVQRQQLQQDSAKAEAEAALRRKAAETTKGIIKLNVGGVKFTTSLTALTAVPASYFVSLFSGDWQQVLTAEGEVFLDRDGEVSAN